MATRPTIPQSQKKGGKEINEGVKIESRPFHGGGTIEREEGIEKDKPKIQSQ